MMERIGLVNLVRRARAAATFIDGDPVAAVMSFNVHRRHLGQQDCADAIVAWIATIAADYKPGQLAQLLSSRAVAASGTRSRRRSLAINAELPKEQQVSERTSQACHRRSTGCRRRWPKPKPQPKELPDDYREVLEALTCARTVRP